MSEVTKEDFEMAIVCAAYVVVRHGPRYAPLLDRLEREYKARFTDPVAKAQAILDRYRASGQRGKAILLSHSAK